ncbi:MAG: PEP-utilizing enzyme [Candidatus Kuenenbacteria bacterium]
MPVSCKTVIKKIQNTKWWAEESPGLPFLFDYIMKAFTRSGKIVGFPALKETITITKNNISLEITPYKEKKKVFIYFLNRELKKPGFTETTFLPWRKLLQKDIPCLNSLVVNKIRQYSDKQLLNFTRKLIETTFEATVYATLIECIDPFSESWQEEFRLKYKLDINQAQELFILLSSPADRSFLTQEKIDFCRLCLGEITIENYLKNWYWIQSNYKQSVDIRSDKLKNKVKKELRQKSKQKVRQEIKETIEQEKRLIKQKEKAIARIKLTKKDKAIFKLFEIFGSYIDLRKESMIRYTYSRDKLLVEISKRTKYSLSLLRNMRDNEVINILQGKDIDLKNVKNRHLIYAAYYTPKGESIYHNKGARAIYSAWIKSIKSKEIKGQVASSPIKKISGKVSVVVDVYRDKFRPGTILVTTMTRPEFMPLMRKAKAVITDEGGITCHAAIVSRELNIPCIIGTKNATKILKSGDLVEVDAEKGVVRKLK